MSARRGHVGWLSHREQSHRAIGRESTAANDAGKSRRQEPTEPCPRVHVAHLATLAEVAAGQLSGVQLSGVLVCGKTGRWLPRLDAKKNFGLVRMALSTGENGPAGFESGIDEVGVRRSAPSARFTGSCDTML